MKLSIVAFNEKGAETADRVRRVLGEFQIEECIKPKISVAKWSRKQFEEKRGLIFVGACGIAVRAIALCLENKLTDPPVLVIDDEAKYVIPILSGHVGGANVLAVILAERLGAEAVVTTASDADLLHREYVLGVGCKSGKKKDEIKAFISRQLENIGIGLDKIFTVASIDQKRSESGLCEWVEEERLSFVTFSADSMEKAGWDFSASDFVKKTVGVDNVCERAAVLAGGKRCELVLRKQAENGMTLAVARRRVQI